MPAIHWIKESAFGIWFLGTDTWKQRVLTTAISDLLTIFPNPPQDPLILDVGCGKGNSFALLEERLCPRQITGIEIDPELLPNAVAAAEKCGCSINVIVGNAETLPFPDQSFDIIFCHQSFHHIVQHSQAMGEFYRVLKTGGVLLFAESCKRFIHSLPIRLLFRHPMDVQKTAGQYIDLIRASGFRVNDKAISKPYIWWSRPDIGALEWLGFALPKQTEPTLLNLAAVK